MKIGIITVHNGFNYGASLQAFALVRYLRMIGQDAFLIDYRNPKIEGLQRHLNRIDWKHPNIRNLKNALNYRSRNKMELRYREFHGRIIDKNNLCIINKNQLDAITAQYDAFVCGSDQIWNSKITGGDLTFFLDFAHNKNKCVSYAASVGGEKLEYNESHMICVRQLLSNFSSLSVREKINVQEIETISGKKCNVVLDPTLLLDSEEWEKIAEEAIIKIPKKPYMIYYQVLDDDSFYPNALKFAKKKGLQLVRMDWHLIKATTKGCVSVSGQGIGPCEFLKLFKEAEFVVSNSFHGTVFALMFHKNFITYSLRGGNKKKSSRIIELLENAGLEDRFRDNFADHECADIDWNQVNSRLSQYIIQSRKYLLDAFKCES